jgi:hypothetical protein
MSDYTIRYAGVRRPDNANSMPDIFSFIFNVLRDDRGQTLSVRVQFRTALSANEH